ncbi:hypothetical protein K435DRAFT_654572 [Dendrothele bispora CBS 962.96]|uniref:Nucleoporin Nup133/Nup155-like C-terminal domain-containing protein n=1 Tax=Dendrothele bispora (strain CBS 962.96) TaxID=1314807 RepID=A0A4S8MH21_DENBC|nr:hypothetical protein K435DRAFT_654572 [Dendrothele bispora CBS 962.96]
MTEVRYGHTFTVSLFLTFAYAIAFDLPILKLLCLHISEHRDKAMVKQIWNQIFDQIIGDTTDPQAQADQVVRSIVPLGQRFYPSESAFPLRKYPLTSC